MVEVVVAVSIMTVSILSAMMVAQKTITVSNQSLHATQAVFLLEEGAELVRIARDNSWSNISTPNFVNYSTGIFTRKVSLANVNRDNTTKDIVSTGGTLDNSTKLVTVTVSWPEGGQTISKNLQFYIMDIF